LPTDPHSGHDLYPVADPYPKREDDIMGKMFVAVFTLGLFAASLQGQEVTRVATVRVQSEPLFAISFTPDGKELVPNSPHGIIAITMREEYPVEARPIYEVRLTDRVTGKALCMLDRDRISLTPAVSPDGKTVAAYFVNEISLYDVATGRKKMDLHGHPAFVHAVAFSPDGKSLVSCGREGMRVWDLVTGKEIRFIDAGVGQRSIAFSPDGKFIATGTEAGDIVL
jgi:WD40 repeat protein